MPGNSGKSDIASHPVTDYLTICIGQLYLCSSTMTLQVRYSKSTATDQLIISVLKTTNTISQKKEKNALAVKPIYFKPPTGDKTLGIETEIRFYEIEEGDNTEEVEE